MDLEEATKWCWRHSANLYFVRNESNTETEMIIEVVDRKKELWNFHLYNIDHHEVPTYLAKSIEAISARLNME